MGSQHCQVDLDVKVTVQCAYLSASSGRSSNRGKNAPSSALRPALSLGWTSTAVNSFVAAAKASSYGDMQLRSRARHSGCRSCSKNCTTQKLCSDHGTERECMRN